MSDSLAPTKPYIVIKPVGGGLVKVNLEFVGSLVVGALQLEGQMFEKRTYGHQIPVELDLPEGSSCASNPYIGPVKIRDTVKNLLGQAKEQFRYVDPIALDGRIRRLKGWPETYLQFICAAVKSTGATDRADKSVIKECDSCLIAGKELVDQYGVFITRPMTLSMNQANAKVVCEFYERREQLMRATFGSAANKLSVFKTDVLSLVVQDIADASKIAAEQDDEVTAFLNSSIREEPVKSDTIAGHYPALRELLNNSPH